MSVNVSEAIRLVVQEQGISEELVVKTIQDTLMAAYKRKFGTVENAVFDYDEERGEVSIHAKKMIVEEVDDEALEISLEDAKDIIEDCEIGDELMIEIDPSDFDRGAVQSAKQKTRQSLRDIHKDTLYAEYKDKEGEIIIGYYQREVRGNIIVDLGKTEGIFPKRFQSPRETYRNGDRIKALIAEVAKGPMGLQIVLSRTHTDFVKKIFELEVPEVYDKTVEILKIVREPGYRTKLAVWSNREDVDPVGACVGLKGVRIQAVVRELEGERIDILKYDTDPKTFIRNALSPAEVEQIIILDEHKRQALAVVDDSQLSLAIGKQGQNVRLANRLVDWNIDVKTRAQFAEMDIQVEKRMAVKELFNDLDDEDEISKVAELPGIPADLVKILADNNIHLIADLVELTNEQVAHLAGLDPEHARILEEIIANNVEIAQGATQQNDSYGDNYYGNEQYGPEQADVNEAVNTEADSDDEEEITYISELPDVPEGIVRALETAGISEIVDLINMNANQLRAIEGLSDEDVKLLLQIIEDTVEIIEEDE
jgi:transcription termination/antitermination protein NusA